MMESSGGNRTKSPCLAGAKLTISRPMQRATYHRVEWAQDTTDLTTSKPTLAGIDPPRRDGVVELDFDKSISDGVNIYAKRDGDADFVFLARDNASPYIDNRLLLVATKPELCEYKAVYVLSDAEIGLFSDEVVVNCAP